MKRLWLLMLMIWAFCGTNSGWALDCGACGRKELPALAMHCPDCHGLLYQSENRVKAKKSAVLIVEIHYIGDKPDKLPEYAKLYINRKYVGNVPQVEKEARGQSLSAAGRTGLGFDYTAKYQTELRQLHVGMVDVEVEMRFKRLFGVSRSHRKVLFKNVNLKPDEKTFLRHYFDSAGKFSRLKPEKPAEGRTKSGDSYVPELKMGTGTLTLETPVF